MTQSSKLKIKNLRPTLVVTILLLVVFLLPFLSMRNFSPVSDEITHLPSGYSYFKTGEIKLNPQHPPFIKMLAALPLLFLDLKFNAADSDLAGPQLNEWQFGRNFLSENGIDRIIFWGRIPMVLLSVLLGFYIFRWGKELFNYQVGTLSLLIYAFMPNIIAHSQLVTTDMGLAAFSFISLYYFWRLLKAELKSRKDLIFTGVFLGLALGSKFSAIFLLPVFPILLVIYFSKKSGIVLYKFNSLLKIILPIYGLAFLVVWALYFFPSDPLFYYKGLKTVYADNNPDFQYYLSGNFKQGGWWYYFIWAFIIKTPIPFLVALFAALTYWRKNGLDSLNNLFILLPPALFLFIASWKAHNIGVRYILPVYPFLILFAGRYVSEKIRNLTEIPSFTREPSPKKLEIRNYRTKIKIIPILIFVLAVWYVFSSVNAYPDYLAYFNELIGGPQNGYKHLDDSNIDWGQDLKRLAQYQKKSPDLQVVYTWDTFTGASKMYGIKNILPLNLQDQWWANPSGKYAINVHALIRLKLASQKYENDRLNWKDLYKPVDRIGQSFFIYEFP